MVASKSIFPVIGLIARLLNLALVILLFAALPLRAATGGSISGTVTDPSGAALTGVSLSLINTAQQTTYPAISDVKGFYTFPNLPVGHYDLTVSATGFTTQRKMDLTVDTDSALRVDTALSVGARSDAVVVTADPEVE